MTSSTNSLKPKAPSDSRTAYLQTALPLLALYVFFVWRTPGSVLNADGIAFALMRVGILLMWLAIMYFFRLKRNIPWNERHFVVGVVVGVPWISALGAYKLITSLGRSPEWYDYPLEGYLAWIASGIFYGILSGLWSAQTKTSARAAISGFLFFLLQFVVDGIFLLPFTYVK